MVGNIAAEVFYNHLNLLGNGGWMQADKAHHVRDGGGLVYFLGSAQFVADFRSHGVGGVVGEHVHDEVLGNGLAHGIRVEGDVVAVRSLRTE